MFGTQHLPPPPSPNLSAEARMRGTEVTQNYSCSIREVKQERIGSAGPMVYSTV